MADLRPVIEHLPVQISDIIGRNYAEVKRQLSLTNDLNKCVDIPYFSMTGLEFSVFQLDWKMFLIFFLGGTDPSQNLFHGIWLLPSSDEPVIQVTVYRYRSEEGKFQPVPGFRGFQFILDDVVGALVADGARFSEDRRSKMGATLWLTKQLHDNSAIVLGSDMISQARHNCLLLDNDFAWESAFSSKVASCLAILKQIGETYQVPEEALHSVFEHRLHQLLNGAIRECLEGIVGGLGPGLEEANEEET
jgi:hypothetical protein